jgi:large subunit ribosomal protein L10
MLTREQKKEQSERLRATLGDVNTLFLVDNRGLNVNQVNQLRSEIRKTDASYRVVKNSVMKLAVEGTDMEALTPYLVGPKALAYTAGDGVALAKVLHGFIKTHPALSFQQAFLDGQILEPEAARKMADLPSRDELVAKFLYLLQSPIRRLVVALGSPVQGLANVLDQVAKKKETES